MNQIGACGWLAGVLLAAASGPALELRNLAAGANSEVQKAQQKVVRSEAEFRTLWSQHRGSAGTGGPALAGAPPVDWTKEMVLAVFMGTRPTGGYAVRIREVREEKGKLVVAVEERKPGPGSITTQALTSPFHIVAVKKSALPVQWQVVAPSK